MHIVVCGMEVLVASWLMMVLLVKCVDSAVAFDIMVPVLLCLVGSDVLVMLSQIMLQRCKLLCLVGLSFQSERLDMDAVLNAWGGNEWTACWQEIFRQSQRWLSWSKCRMIRMMHWMLSENVLQHAPYGVDHDCMLHQNRTPG
jgi:hypothetical protein